MTHAPPLRSMTGYGMGEAALGEGLLRVEIRAVNHRHLDLRVRAPSDLLDLNHIVEEVLRARVVRGRVEVQVRWEGPAGAHGPLDLGAARRAYAALCTLRDELSPGEVVPIAAVLNIPELLRAAPFERRLAEQAAAQATARAEAALAEMREREGAALREDLLARTRLLRFHVAWVQAERPRILTGYRERLVARIGRLLEGTDLAADPARIAQEVAWFAERSDVAEEITRLGSHLTEFERALETPSETVGRKLDFLVQELGREINTIGSKANDAALGQRVVEMKAELERIREQVQNIL